MSHYRFSYCTENLNKSFKRAAVKITNSVGCGSNYKRLIADNYLHHIGFCKIFLISWVVGKVCLFVESEPYTYITNRAVIFLMLMNAPFNSISRIEVLSHG